MGRYDALLQVDVKPTPSSPDEVSPPIEKPPRQKAPTIPIPVESVPTTSERDPADTLVRRSESAPVRTPVRVKRTSTRYAFEFFQDQVETLKRFSIEEQIRGEKGSMSQMVREALDAYIAKRKRTEE